MAKGAIHEEVKAHDADFVVGSDRKFGLLFFIVFLMVGLFPLLAHHEIRIWGLIVSGVFLVAALLVPRALRPLNVVWMRLGWVLGKIVSPIVLGALFFLAVLPMGLFMRLRGKDLLRLKMDPGAKSYWIERTPPGPAPDTMKNQF